MMMTRRFRPPEQLLLPWSPKNTISVSHAAEMLDVCVDVIYRMIEAGELKAYKVRPDRAKSPWRVNYDSILAHIEKMHDHNGLEKRF
jgi:excisionase family DNA binding protein